VRYSHMLQRLMGKALDLKCIQLRNRRYKSQCTMTFYVIRSNPLITRAEGSLQVHSNLSDITWRHITLNYCCKEKDSSGKGCDLFSGDHRFECEPGYRLSWRLSWIYSDLHKNSWRVPKVRSSLRCHILYNFRSHTTCDNGGVEGVRVATLQTCLSY